MQVFESKNSELVNIWIINKIADVIEAEGFDAKELLAQLNLSREEIARSGAFVSLECYISCIEKVVSMTNVPYFGLVDSKYFRLLDPGLLSYTMLYSRDLVQALDSLIRYWSLDGPFSGKIYLADSLVFELYDLSQDSDVANRYFAENLLACITDILRYNNPSKKVLSRVCFKFDGSEYLSMYEAIFQCPVGFNQQKNQLVFHPSAMKEIQLNYNPELYLVVKKQCEQKLSLLNVENDIVNSIYKILFSCKNYSPTIDEVAAMFNTSTATLKRRLAEKETSYKAIVSNYRITQASRLLSDTDISISDIAELIGYANANNFSRAFTKNRFCSPTEYRKNYYKR